MSQTSIQRLLDFFNDLENGKLEYEVEQPKFLLEEAESSLSTSNAALAPMPGVLDKILVNIGDQIKKGDPVVVIIAMKMEFIVRATRDARVCGILHKVGENVPKDTVLVQFEDV